jgi:hypothetical protein
MITFNDGRSTASITEFDHKWGVLPSEKLVMLTRQPDGMRVRRRTVEHPFGTLKFWLGALHFLTRTLPRVSTEMSLHVLAYNLKRVLQILGIGEMLRVSVSPS